MGQEAAHHEVSGGRGRGSAATGKVSISSMCPLPQSGQSRKDTQRVPLLLEKQYFDYLCTDAQGRDDDCEP